MIIVAQRSLEFTSRLPNRPIWRARLREGNATLVGRHRTYWGLLGGSDRRAVLCGSRCGLPLPQFLHACAVLQADAGESNAWNLVSSRREEQIQDTANCLRETQASRERVESSIRVDMTLPWAVRNFQRAAVTPISWRASYASSHSP
jgi:hypothetical protein